MGTLLKKSPQKIWFTLPRCHCKSRVRGIAIGPLKEPNAFALSMLMDAASRAIVRNSRRSHGLGVGPIG